VSYLEAISAFQQAIDFDPAYPQPHVGMADTWVMMGSTVSALLPKCIRTHDTVRGDVSKGFDRNWEQAERRFQKALRLNPNYAVAHQWYANLFSILDRHAEAIAAVEQARRLDPLSASIAGFVGFTYYRARRHDDALREVRKASGTRPCASNFELVPRPGIRCARRI